MAKFFILLVTSTLFASIYATDNRACYHLDGSLAAKHVPCSTKSVTNCCASNDLCMSNGLCYLQGQHGLSLTRGSCSDKGWGSDCYAPCSKYRRNTGMPIMNIGFNYSQTQYCCGTAISDNGNVGCKYEEPFELSQATVIPGVAYLANNNAENCSSPSSPPASSSCVAVEAGVGVPLGVIAIATAIWALWERRNRRHPRHLLVNDSERGVSPASSGRQLRTAELNASGATSQLPELMDTGNEYKEAPAEMTATRNLQDVEGSTCIQGDVHEFITR